MIIYSYGKHLFCLILSNNILVKISLNFMRFWYRFFFRNFFCAFFIFCFKKFFIQNLVAKLNTFITYIHFRTRNKLFYLILRLTAK